MGDLTTEQRIQRIEKWIGDYARGNKIQTLVVGISGGIDSAVVSALCARTGLATIAVSMPIRQSVATHDLSLAQGRWLTERFSNVRWDIVDLTPTFQRFEQCFDQGTDLAFANSRSRLRMMCLYQIAQDHSGIVVGTGNRVEDFGVGFFTKYGDGGVDISPIGHCLKTQVWDMGRELGILPEIIDAEPTDGLWADGRTDESQLGMSYPELEQAMRLDALDNDHTEILGLDRGQRDRLLRYREIRSRNLHKMLPIPVCSMEDDRGTV